VDREVANLLAGKKNPREEKREQMLKAREELISLKAKDRKSESVLTDITGSAASEEMLLQETAALALSDSAERENSKDRMNTVELLAKKAELENAQRAIKNSLSERKMYNARIKDLAAAKQRLMNEIDALPTAEQLLADQDSASKKIGAAPARNRRMLFDGLYWFNVFVYQKDTRKDFRNH